MAATKEAMTTLSSSQTFLPTAEEPENNRINFRDSLKFFQEQLVINGANFPTPSSGCSSGNNTLKRNGSLSYKENTFDKSKTFKDTDAFKEEIQPTRSCKIAIPTVDTILESVRVLRAIQKSQEEQGSFWNLDVSSKPNIDSYFHYKDDEIPFTNDNDHFNQNSDKKMNNDSNSVISIDKSAKAQLTNNDIPNMETEVSQLDVDIKNGLTGIQNSKAEEEICSFWPSNSLVINSNSDSENEIKNSHLSLETKNEHINGECYKIVNESAEALSESKLNIKNDSTFVENQNYITSGQLELNDNHESVIEKSTEKESQLKNDSASDERLDDDENLDRLKQNENHENLFAISKENITELEESNSDDRQNNENITQFQQNDNHEKLIHPKENDFQLKNNSNSEDGENNEITGEKDNDKHKNTSLEIVFENKSENINSITKACDTLDSLNEDIDFKKFSEVTTDTESFVNELSIKSEPLKIETYDGTETQKSNAFMVNGSHWKDSCSPNDRSSIKTEPTDSDSGFGTQRSGSSLSPSNYSQMQKDSWSDSCSSQYASAECSPYHSLSSVFECSSLLSTVGETKTTDNVDILSDFNNGTWEDTSEKVEPFKDKECDLNIQQSNNAENDLSSDISNRNCSNVSTDFDFTENAELDTEISYCNFTPNYTIKNPSIKTKDSFQAIQQVPDICDSSENNTGNVCNQATILHEQTDETNKDIFLSITNTKENEQDDSCDLSRTQKFTSASCDLISIVQSLYTIKENPAYQIFSALDGHEEKFEEKLLILSEGAFSEFSEDNYLVIIEDSTMHIKKESEVLCSLNIKYGEVFVKSKTVLEIDNKMGKSVYIQSNADDLMHLKTKIEVNILRHWQTDCLQLVHYPLKCHQNVVIIDLGSCSTRAGILMDQPTLPSLFFPTICATDKTTGTNVYGMEALQSEVRQHSNLSFPVRPTIKITKHTIDINLLEGLFKKIFSELKIDPTEYAIQVCLPRNLSINAQTALVTLLLEDLKVKAVSLSNQALLTLYAHEVSTAVVVDIGDRIDVLPVVDGFIVENGVTKLPHGGQRLIHHMKHGLAEKRISLSNEIDSFIVQYIIENLAYVAENYEKEIQIATQYPDRLKKTVTLQPASSESFPCKTITLEEARFKIPEGLFNPDFWGLDSPGIHHLVQKAIQATSVDARKQIAENIYVSGGVTMLPGFVERLSKEMIKLSKTKILPKVHASNYRYHCTYIGACKFAKMDVFPKVCINLEDYSRNGISALKKCALCF